MLNLEKARDIAESVRYSDDKKSEISNPEISESVIESVRNDLLRDCLRITRYVTPKLYSQIETAAQRLHIPAEMIEGYVEPTHEINASCFYPTDSYCIIRVSAGLVELLDTDEMTFVIGHELGHFLLNHGDARHAAYDSNVERKSISKRMEISADRIGLLACNDIEKAVWAMMKSSTGLSASHLRFDTHRFISQITESEDLMTLAGLHSTHPSMYVRTKALLWQDLKSKSIYESKGGEATEAMNIDEKIRNILKKYEDGKLESILKKRRTEVVMWAIAIELINEKKTTAPRVVNKDVLIEIVGEDDATSLLRYVGRNPTNRTLEDATRRFNEATSQLELLSPEDTKWVLSETVATAKQSLWS